MTLTQDLQAGIDAAAGAGADSFYTMPAGTLEIDAPLILRSGVNLMGRGSHNTTAHGGTMLKPSSSFPAGGVAAVHFPTTEGICRHGSLQNFGVRDFPVHGVWFEGGMGENTIIDRVAATNSGGDGIRVAGGFSTPGRIGFVSVHGNAGYGLYIKDASTSWLIDYVGGDNNLALIRIEGSNEMGVHRILAWKAERWLPNPGHNVVLSFHNLNGGIVDYGQGRVHMSGNIPTAPYAVVHQTHDEGNGNGYVKGIVARNPPTWAPNGAADYQYGYVDDKSGTMIAMDDFVRYDFSTIKTRHAMPWAPYQQRKCLLAAHGGGCPLTLCKAQTALSIRRP